MLGTEVLFFFMCLAAKVLNKIRKAGQDCIDTKKIRQGSNPCPLGLESSTLPLSHCAPSVDRRSLICT